MNLSRLSDLIIFRFIIFYGNIFFQNTTKEIVDVSLLCLLVICHEQDVDIFTSEVMECLDERSFILEEICNIAETKSVSPFFSPYVKGLIK